jgi:hypothetical protein
MEELVYNWKLYLSCDTVRKTEFMEKLIAADRAMLLSIIELPQDSQDRFRVYDLLVRIRPDGDAFLQHVLEECQDDSDPLNQLAAIEFVYENKMNDLANFIDLFNRNLENSLTIVSIAQTVAEMILVSDDPVSYSGVVATILERSFASNSDLLGVLPRLTSNPTFARMILDSESFQTWISQVPASPELKTFNIYMRTLLARVSERPMKLLLDPVILAAALIHPAPGLRCAAFEHIAELSRTCRSQLLDIPRIRERLRDVSMDSTQDEMLARRKALSALGIDGGAGIVGAGRQQVEDMGPDLMVI